MYSKTKNKFFLSCPIADKKFASKKELSDDCLSEHLGFFFIDHLTVLKTVETMSLLRWHLVNVNSQIKNKNNGNIVQNTTMINH